MDEIDLKAKIFYYFNNKCYNLMINACKEGITKFKGSIAFRLYYALSLFLTNRLEESIHDLESIRQENDIKLAVTIALMYGNRLLGVTNRELFQKLDAQMRELRKNSEPVDFYHSAFVLVTLGKLEKALDYAEKALTLQSSLDECLTLKGWILLRLNRIGKGASTVKSMLETALQQNPKNITTITTYTDCLLHINERTEALNTINKAVVRYTSTILPLIHKMKIHFALQDWDQVEEIIQRITSVDPKNLDIKKYTILVLLCKHAKHSEAAAELETYLKLLENVEPNNTKLILETSQLFSRLCGRNTEILGITSKMLDIALQSDSDNAELVVELGYQCYLQGKTREASRYFKSATKLDETSFGALLGLSLCEYSDNSRSEALRKQLDFLLELKEAEESLLLKLVQAKASDSTEEALKLLNHICDEKTSQLKAFFYSDVYLHTLDPDFSIEVIKEYVKQSANNLEKPLHLLSLVVAACPGMAEATYLQAKIYHAKGDNSNAMTTLEKLLSNTLDAPSETHLLMAQIQVENGNFDRASQYLEISISNNFKVRENPMYHYCTALVDKHDNNFADAIKALTTALTLVNVGNASLEDKASVYVELIDTLNIVGQTEEASRILQEATESLQGTPEEARILLLSADNMLSRKNVQGAVDLLSRIKPTEPCYKQAKMKQAQILLKYRKDRFAFLEVYQDFVKEDTGPESYVLLGDAYMEVLEPEDALDCYEKALQLKPHDAFLAFKMGKALVETHYFSRAVKYYQEAIKSNNDPKLKLELADLYLNLKEYENGELLLLNELEEEKVDKTNTEDISYLQYKSKLLHLLAQIQEKSGNTVYAIKSLKDAMDCQNRVRKRMAIDQNAVPENELNFLVSMAIKLGEMAMSLKNNEQAVNYYKEGLEASPNNISILVALAKLYMQMNHLEQCQHTCNSILRLDPDNEAASIMMADIAFRKVDFDMASFHFTQLLAKQPANWEALVRLIEISRRMGNIEECEEYLKSAEKNCENPGKNTGFLYCTALYQWYSGNLNGALRNFNGARQDPVFGLNAIYGMIEICLDPDDEMLGEHFLDTDDIEYRDSRSMALKTADRLLKELKQRLEASGDDLVRHRLLSDFRLLATKEKFNIDRALEDLIALASQSAYKDNTGATLGIATAYTLLKQGQRAKNQLKRVAKTTWTYEDAEYLERCWILLADQYIQSAKFDIANELIGKVIQHNKACTKAYEFLGFIAEKEQRYKDAANFYHETWKFGGRNNPGVGYKLAYCLMKCKKIPHAIDVAQEVLKLNPDYPRIRKDILDKCINNLRT